ncbi:MAG: hypothetical protein ACT4P6_02325 [Gemmatimonadaceae bacterium]
MQAKRHMLRSLIAAIASGLLLSTASDAVAAQSKQKPATKKPTTQTPIVTPTASEGTTAIAARGRPATSPAGRAVNAALKTALANANVRNAVRAEVLRQLRVRRPFAIVNGYLASAIDLTSVYQAAGVRPALLAALGVNGPQLIKDAGVSADRLTISFVPATFGQIVLPQFMGDITRTLGVNALQNHMTDVGPLLMIVVLAGSGFITTVSLANSLAAFLDWLFREDPPECEDNMPTGDCDGDGVQNGEDEYPFDEDKQICDCGRPRAAISLTTSAAGDILPSLVSVLSATQPQKAKAISLGAVSLGQPVSLAFVF